MFFINRLGLEAPPLLWAPLSDPALAPPRSLWQWEWQRRFWEQQRRKAQGE
jgi:hypothetical protein